MPQAFLFKVENKKQESKRQKLRQFTIRIRGNLCTLKYPAHQRGMLSGNSITGV